MISTNYIGLSLYWYPSPLQLWSPSSTPSSQHGAHLTGADNASSSPNHISLVISRIANPQPPLPIAGRGVPTITIHLQYPSTRLLPTFNFCSVTSYSNVRIEGIGNYFSSTAGSTVAALVSQDTRFGESLFCHFSTLVYSMNKKGLYAWQCVWKAQGKTELEIF